jgi:hypothetical protein
MAEIEPERHLRNHLLKEGFLACLFGDYEVRRMGDPGGVGIDGWSFFRTVRTDVDDAEPRYRVVRDDGSLVTDDPEGELQTIYRSMGVRDADDPPTRTMAEAATALFLDGTALLRAEWLELVPDQFPEHDSDPPSVRWDGTDLVLTFFVRGASVHRTLEECTVTVGPGYDVAFDRRKLL